MSDEEAKAETLAIRFANAENAKKFKGAFDEAVVSMTELEAIQINAKDDGDSPEEEVKETEEKKTESDKEVNEKLSDLTI